MDFTLYSMREPQRFLTVREGVETETDILTVATKPPLQSNSDFTWQSHVASLKNKKQKRPKTPNPK